MIIKKCDQNYSKKKFEKCIYHYIPDDVCKAKPWIALTNVNE